MFFLETVILWAESAQFQLFQQGTFRQLFVHLCGSFVFYKLGSRRFLKFGGYLKKIYHK